MRFRKNNSIFAASSVTMLLFIACFGCRPAVDVDRSLLEYQEVGREVVWNEDGSSRFEIEVQLFNRGPKNIDIDAFRASCDCISIEPQKMRLGAGESKTVKCFVPTKDRPKAQDGPLKSSSHTIQSEFSFVPETSDGRAWKAFTTSVDSTFVFLVEDSVVGLFGIKSLPSSRESTIDLVRIHSAEGAELNCECPAEFGKCVLRTVANGIWVPQITFKKNIVPGAFSFQVTIVAKRDGEKVDQGVIRVEGEFQSSWEISPDDVMFGVVDREDAATHALTVRHREGLDFELHVVDTFDWKVKESIVGVGEKKLELAMDFSGQPEGDYYKRVQFKCKDSAGNCEVLFVEIVGFVMENQINAKE